MATRDIAFGKQLLVNYGKEYWHERHAAEQGKMPFRMTKIWFKRNQKAIDEYSASR
jgi:hypothetical protein